MTTNNNTATSEAIEKLTQEIDVLIDRLEKGQELYDQEKDLDRKDRIYVKWNGVLQDYTRLCDERRALGYVYTDGE